MTIRHLKTFCAVCRLGGITRAAEELCVAQPSVSQTVSELERYYGVKLFDRMGRKLLLTPEGERLRVKAEEAIAAFRNLRRRPGTPWSAALCASEHP